MKTRVSVKIIMSAFYINFYSLGMIINIMSQGKMSIWLLVAGKDDVDRELDSP